MANDEIIVRKLVRGFFGAVILALLVWPVDWLVWRVRVAAGGGTGQVVVSQFTVAELKGNKEDYYYEGTGPADCSQSLLPHGGNSACWWLQRHTQVVQKY